ncbi:sensor histidine kinase [Hymenobacter algoricola]
MYFLLPSIGYWFARNAIRLEKQKREQEHDLRVAERNLMEANLAFLKNQINPHFLFNSLNFLYAQVYPYSEETAKGILLLSDIMRYALKEDDNNGKVMLEKEVQHLHNYIAINQLRFNQRLQIQFEISGSLQFMMILPLVLITFVENCFKHGELSDPQNPLLIQITTVNNQLTFRTRNKKRDGPKEKSTGIGLDNTQRRLDMVYPERYVLTVNDEQDYYTCTLIIEL